MVIRLILDRRGLQEDAQRLSAARVRAVTRQVLTRSAILAPVDTGRLRASGRMDFRITGRGPIGKVEYPVRYAAAVEDGTAPHIIKARKRKVLKFQMAGKTVFATSVHHPGTPARPFLTRAAREIAAGAGLRYLWRR